MQNNSSLIQKSIIKTETKRRNNFAINTYTNDYKDSKAPYVILITTQ